MASACAKPLVSSTLRSASRSASLTNATLVDGLAMERHASVHSRECCCLTVVDDTATTTVDDAARARGTARREDFVPKDATLESLDVEGVATTRDTNALMAKRGEM